jgi:hypothetical protein
LKCARNNSRGFGDHDKQMQMIMVNTCWINIYKHRHIAITTSVHFFLLSVMCVIVYERCKRGGEKKIEWKKEQQRKNLEWEKLK